MNYLRNIFTRFGVNNLSFNMETMENYLYYSHEKLISIIQLMGDDNLGVQEYLKTVKYAPIDDFKEGLEWFNVTEPLSFQKHLKGKVVVLDFFTYCCINCMHIIPDLREIENKFSVEDGLVVIGVHSAKFENEKNSSNILAAVQRYNIGHPVVNDYNFEMWKKCDVNCWPTLLMLGPNANPIVMLTGEGHKDDLILYIKNTLEYYKAQNLISDHKLTFETAYHLLPDLKGPLLFPGKITRFVDENNHDILAISDTGNNRILIVKEDGTILKQIGGKRLGFKDGNLETAEFNNPQGLVFQNKDVLFVADTENHAIRKIDLRNNKVETVAGTGHQGHDRLGGKLNKNQAISSPWDLCIYKTSDMDLTFHPDGNPPLRDVLIIAMAGTHQIWAIFLEDTVWWKCKKYPAGTCINIAGTGKEENRNNNYPHAAAFAQPSGLALDRADKAVYIADSESSSVRRLSLVDGKVTPVVGGDKNPTNLFAFGDKDGSIFEAKLQHPLGLAFTMDGSALFVADTYNHKIKKIDPVKNTVSSLSIPTREGTSDSWSFKEPAGLCFSSDNKKLFVADTNNHQIKILCLNSNLGVTKVETMHLVKENNIGERVSKTGYKILGSKPIVISSKGGKLTVNLVIDFEGGLSLTGDDAPQSWFVDLPEVTWSAAPKSGTSVKDIDVVISFSEKRDAKERSVDFVFNLVTCTNEACLPKNFVIRVPVDYSTNVKSNVHKKIRVVLNPAEIKLI